MRSRAAGRRPGCRVDEHDVVACRRRHLGDPRSHRAGADDGDGGEDPLVVPVPMSLLMAVLADVGVHV